MQKSPLEQYKQDMIERVGSYKTNSSLQKASREFLYVEDAAEGILLPAKKLYYDYYIKMRVKRQGNFWEILVKKKSMGDLGKYHCNIFLN